MMKLLVLLAFILALLISFGQSLVCYSCYDTYNHGSCDNPTTCNSTDTIGLEPPYERCLVTRLTEKGTGKKTERRSCAHAFQCNTAYSCSFKAPKDSENSTCEIGCCDSDLCNSDSLALTSKPPQTYEPSGPDLSCYSCSDVKNVMKNTFFSKLEETTSCSEGPKHSRKCSTDNVFSDKDMKEDRCLTLKLQVKDKTGEIKEMVVRNCSNFVMCDVSNPMWAFAMNETTDTTVVSAQASCCSGNLCEPKIDEKPTKIDEKPTKIGEKPTIGTTDTSSAKTGLSGLLALVMVILISLVV